MLCKRFFEITAVLKKREADSKIKETKKIKRKEKRNEKWKTLKQQEQAFLRKMISMHY